MRLHILVHEQLLRAVNAHVCWSVHDQTHTSVSSQERATGRLSGVHHIVDLTGFEIGAAALQMAYDGALAYFAQTMHYEHYPELVTLTQFVNSSQWIATPYKVLRLIYWGVSSEKINCHISALENSLEGVVLFL